MDANQPPSRSATDAVAGYVAAAASAPGEDAPLDGLRFAVIDTESTGLNPKKDRLVGIGGVAVSGGEIRIADGLELVVVAPGGRESVTIHGITPAQAERGTPEPEALLALLAFVRADVVVGHHVEFDLEMVDRALVSAFGIRLRNPYLDTARLALRLERAGAPISQIPVHEYALDPLCERYHIPTHDRHTAPGDAFITAQLFLKLLARARAGGTRQLGEIARFRR